MNKYFSIFFSVGFCLLNGPANEVTLENKAKEAYRLGDYTLACQCYEEALRYSENPGPLLVKLAMSYEKAQERQKAFRTYLKALDKSPEVALKTCDPEDELLMDEALRFQLQGSDPKAGAREVINRYKEQLVAHPQYVLLNFVVSLAEANCGRFNEFFDHFYQSFIQYPDHYLVEKTKGILHVKLIEQLGEGIDREKERKLAIKSFISAIQVHPKDPHLYELAVGILHNMPGYSQERLFVLQTLVDNEVALSRKDIMPYVHEAVNSGDRELALKIIALAKKNYPYSRALQSAEQYVNARSGS